ncbi:MAG: hypothetical protein WBZ42_02405 [Halobacteriota archaeon]
MRVDANEEAVRRKKPGLRVLTHPDKTKMEHCVPFRPRIVDCKPLLHGRENSGDLRKFYEQATSFTGINQTELTF